MKLLSAEDLNFENDLAHFGVLGMKWGRRKAKSSSGGSSRKQRRAENMDPEKKKKRLENAAMITGLAIGAAMEIALAVGVTSNIKKAQKKYGGETVEELIRNLAEADRRKGKI